MHLLGRTQPLHIFAEQGLKTIIDTTHAASRTVLQYPLHFHPLNFGGSEVIYEDEKMKVSTLIMRHSVPCYGFLFEERPLPLKLIREKLEKYSIPVELLEGIKHGADFIAPGGMVVPNKELTLPPLPQRRYACCSDTLYNEAIIPQIANANLLYHEATFTSDMQQRARQTMHSTAHEAATIAKLAGAGKLIISHFSARYKDLNPLLEEARAIFPNTWLAEEGAETEVG
jgi:ribonuclease Z